jgi:hypothetical protein
VTILLLITSVLEAQQNQPNENKALEGCAHKENSICKGETGNFNLHLIACGENVYYNGDEQIKYLCNHLSNCDEDPEDWECFVGNRKVACYNCITTLYVQKAKIRSGGKKIKYERNVPKAKAENE